MQGISEENIPTFKFFQFKKSMLKFTGEKTQYMLVYHDISQKILYDS